MRRVAFLLTLSFLIASCLIGSPAGVLAGDSEGSNQPQQKATNLWEYYKASGKPLPALSERAEMYQALGLGPASSYTGTASQNTSLLNALKQHEPSRSTFKSNETSYVPPSAGTAESASWDALAPTLQRSAKQPSPTPVMNANAPRVQRVGASGSMYTEWDIQSDVATVMTKCVAAAAQLTSASAPLVQLTGPLSLLFNVVKESEKEGIVLKDIIQAWRDVPEIVQWAKDNPDQALDPLADGLAKVGAVSVNALLDTTGVRALTRLATDDKIDLHITSQQIQSMGRSIGGKIGEIDWRSLPLGF